MKSSPFIPVIIVASVSTVLLWFAMSANSIANQNASRHYASDVSSITLDTTAHKCIDSTHNICDGNCECDGLSCSIPQPKHVSQVFIKQMNVRSDGFVSVRYISTDGQEYAYDYMNQDQFQNIFGFILSTEE